MELKVYRVQRGFNGRRGSGNPLHGVERPHPARSTPLGWRPNPLHGVESHRPAFTASLTVANPLHGVERKAAVVQGPNNSKAKNPLHGVERIGRSSTKTFYTMILNPLHGVERISGRLKA